LIGVAFFDLMPEALDLATAALGKQLVATIMAVGFVAYMLLDRTITPHGDKGPRTEKLWRRGALGAGSLSVHSFLDGFAIGLAFKVSAAVGAIVSAAVLVDKIKQSNPSPFANTPVPARSPTASREAAVIFARPIP
jgi:zinc transporter ZupT